MILVQQWATSQRSAGAVEKNNDYSAFGTDAVQRCQMWCGPLLSALS